MSDNSLPGHWTCLSVDIECYSRWNAVEQADAQRELLHLLDSAAVAAGLDRGQWTRQAQGDGELALIPETEPAVRLVDDFVDELTAELYRRNGDRHPGRRVRLRLALERGVVTKDAANGFAGDPVVAVTRMVGAQVLRTAMSAKAEVNLAVLVSRRVFDDFVGSGLARVSPTMFREVRVKEKKYREQAWMRVPRTDVHQLKLAKPPSGEPRRKSQESGATVVNNIHGGKFRGNVLGIKR